MKAVIRDLVCDLFWKLGLTRPSRYARKKLTAITFHRVLTEEQRAQYHLPNLAVTPEELDWLCKEFKKHFECGPFTEMYQKWQSQAEFEKPLLALTFDDGQEDNYVNAKSVLEENGLRATFYVPVDNVSSHSLIWHDRLGFALQNCTNSDEGCSKLLAILNEYIPGFEQSEVNASKIIQHAKNLPPEQRVSMMQDIESLNPVQENKWAGMMSWQQVIELKNAGHEIGSHSMTHSLLPQLSEAEIEFEICTSREQLAERIGMNVESFSYPNGDENELVRKVVKVAGYSNAVTTRWGINSSGVDNFSIYRCDMDSLRLADRHGRLSPSRLHFRISGYQPGLR